MVEDNHELMDAAMNAVHSSRDEIPQVERDQLKKHVQRMHHDVSRQNSARKS